ncbi:GlxA family transcriptional regulator [Agrobacterium vitis]|uniref:GlxA family transcriptional regulator n=1 Tax=Agrobacterium vitis TaxID=373 RepID=UPI00087334F2|nr:GlxA family transcriptional regulator [Agrobacterium vitis]MCE6076991.1 helix-turn-helix domain-containing protein [Agrobacterium vitis]MCM2449739.1 GlxA family transcriptional regulator [Agrobacterium vitis]MUO71688.1 helix-turn-helix domain-containing protein [Agrobacterium vitis]MUO86234.1 helix-turn-helix domain-containing protein [Agrobacterium vitis]MVA36783.1 helix-turn-helix domain-containing protein [Agrobacterium vitis]
MFKTHKICFLLFDRHQVLDIAGPVAVLSAVNDIFPETPAYEIMIVAERAGMVRSNSALSIIAEFAFQDVIHESVDTLMVAGGSGMDDLGINPAVSEFIRNVGSRAKRICSICTGAHLLGAAGFLDGKRVATHWSAADRLRECFPSVSVDKNAIYVVDGNVWTSAGVTSGLDMTLALVEADHGHDVAISVARRLVVYMIRPGGQSQFSVHLDKVRQRSDLITEALSHIEQNLNEPCCIEDLAAQSGLSIRHFSRRFKEETGQSPATFIMARRLARAQTLLEKSDLPLKSVACQTGFTSASAFRRAFVSQFFVSPHEYRSRFHAKKAR